MFAALTTCPCCQEPLLRPHTVTGCLHSICYPCVETLDLADQETCPICAGPLGTPVMNVALQALQAEVQQPQVLDEQRPWKKVKGETKGETKEETAAAPTDKEKALAVMKTTAAADRQAYSDSLVAFLEETRAHGNRRVAAYSAAAAVVIKDTQAEMDVLAVNTAFEGAVAAAAGAGFAAAAAACPLPRAPARYVHPLPRLTVDFQGALEAVYTATEAAPRASVLAARVLALEGHFKAHPLWAVGMLQAAAHPSDLYACLDMMAAWGGRISFSWPVYAPASIAQQFVQAVHRVFRASAESASGSSFVQLAPGMFTAMAQVMWTVRPAPVAAMAVLCLSVCPDEAVSDTLPRSSLLEWFASRVDADTPEDVFATVVKMWHQYMPCAPVAHPAGIAVAAALTARLPACSAILLPRTAVCILHLVPAVAHSWPEARAEVDAVIVACVQAAGVLRMSALSALSKVDGPPHVHGPAFLACVRIAAAIGRRICRASLDRMLQSASLLSADDRAAARALLANVEARPDVAELLAHLFVV